eukprot:scaffold299505_cov19-Tisochrysis_lutea.AAC.1
MDTKLENYFVLDLQAHSQACKPSTTFENQVFLHQKQPLKKKQPEEAACTVLRAFMEGKARADPILFASADLSSCGLDTEVPGTWRVVFKVRGSYSKHEPVSLCCSLHCLES